MLKESSYHTIILGAGAAGLACAGIAQRAGDILLLDHGQKSACKVDISGGGKANFSNRSMGIEHFHTTNPRFCLSALSRFTPDDCLAWLDDHAVAYEERNHGQLFCSRTAKDFSRALRSDCVACTLLLDTQILKVERGSGLFKVVTSKGNFTAKNIVCALGSPAYPQAGATSLGVRLAQQFGHAVVPFRPALVGLAVAEWQDGVLAGISLPVHIHIHIPPKHPYKLTNFPAPLPLLFTHTGISGPAVLQASLSWEKGWPMTINFLPDLNIEKELSKPGYAKQSLLTVLKGLLPERVAQWLLDAGEIPNIRVAELSKNNRLLLSKTIHQYTVTPQTTEGYIKAEVAKGGVDTAQVSSKTFESKLIEGLYFCGEILDVTGRLGGYNLHWALASGKSVGHALLEKA